MYLSFHIGFDERRVDETDDSPSTSDVDGSGAENALRSSTQSWWLKPSSFGCRLLPSHPGNQSVSNYKISNSQQELIGCRLLTGIDKWSSICPPELSLLAKIRSTQPVGTWFAVLWTGDQWKNFVRWWLI